MEEVGLEAGKCSRRLSQSQEWWMVSTWTEDKVLETGGVWLTKIKEVDLVGTEV